MFCPDIKTRSYEPTNSPSLAGTSWLIFCAPIRWSSSAASSRRTRFLFRRMNSYESYAHAAPPKKCEYSISCLAIEAEMEQTTDEIKRLQGCINDLISIQALPAIWSGRGVTPRSSALCSMSWFAFCAWTLLMPG